MVSSLSLIWPVYSWFNTNSGVKPEISCYRLSYLDSTGCWKSWSRLWISWLLSDTWASNNSISPATSSFLFSWQNLQSWEYASLSLRLRYSYFSVYSLSFLMSCQHLLTIFMIALAEILFSLLIYFRFSWLKNMYGDRGLRGCFLVRFIFSFSWSRSNLKWCE